MDGRKSDQMRPNLRDTKKQDFVKCLKINNLQSLVVPRTGIAISGTIVGCQILSNTLVFRRFISQAVS